MRLVRSLRAAPATDGGPAAGLLTLGNGRDSDHSSDFRQVPDPPARARVTLYINHDPNCRILMRRVAQSLPSVSLVVAASGADGIRAAELRRPDVIVVDDHLPDLTGHDVVVKLRHRPVTRHLPVIALSGNPDGGERARLLEAGASAYLTKPVNLLQLDRTIRCLAGLPVS